MKSTSFTIQELKKLDSLNATITGFLKLPKWTVATGAMLISGVQPVPLAISVPDEACQLSDPISPAQSSQLQSARSVMKDWSEHHEDEDGSSSDVPTEEEPISFLIWCEEEYRGSLRRPVFLDHFLVLAGFENATPVQQNVVARLLELEQHAAVERNRPLSVVEAQLPQADLPTPGFFSKRMVKLVEDRKIKSSIAREIAEALDRTSSTRPLRPQLIWQELLEMAGSGQFPALRPKDTNTIVIPGGSKRTWEPFTLDAFRQWLNRNKTHLLPKANTSDDTDRS
uniref:Uncharacterized protein n=1 Tax=Variovorax paradoxus (strain S110) TaxID=543728 RepID=C5CLE4_VARPS